jgi:hypothetical protein
MNYRHTGYRRPKLRKFANAGVLTSTFIDAPGAGKQILIWDIVVEGGSEFIREGDYNSSNLILKVTEGHTGFVAPLALAENKGLTVDSSGGTTHTIMVHYSIEEV